MSTGFRPGSSRLAGVQLLTMSSWEQIEAKSNTTTGIPFNSSSALISARTSRPSFFGRLKSSRTQIRAWSTGELSPPVKKLECFFASQSAT